MIRFPSWRNEVELRGGVVYKRHGSEEAAAREAENLLALCAKGVAVPRLLARKGAVLELEYLPGATLPEWIARGGYDPAALALALCGWFAAFYAAVPWRRADGNGRNFLYDGARVASVDFEERYDAPPACDAGRLTAFLLDYRTERPEPQAALVLLFAEEFCRRFGCRPEEVAAAREAEFAAMRARRERFGRGGESNRSAPH